MPSLWPSRGLPEHPFRDNRPPNKFPSPFDICPAFSEHSYNPFRDVGRQYRCHIPYHARYSNPYLRGKDRHVWQPQKSSVCHKQSHIPPIVNQIQISGSNGGTALPIRSETPLQYRDITHGSQKRDRHFADSTDGSGRIWIDVAKQPMTHQRSRCPFGEDVPFYKGELDEMNWSDISSESSIDSCRHHHRLSTRACVDLDCNAEPFQYQPYRHHRHCRDQFWPLHDWHRHSTCDLLHEPQYHTIRGREVMKGNRARIPRQQRYS